MKFTQFERACRIVMAVSAFFASLPWLCDPPYYFALPSGEPAPHLGLRVLTPLYRLAESPVHVIGETFHPATDWFFFQGEGIPAVKPYTVFVFWFCVAIVSAWLGVRRRWFGIRRNNGA